MKLVVLKIESMFWSSPIIMLKRIRAITTKPKISAFKMVGMIRVEYKVKVVSKCYYKRRLLRLYRKNLLLVK